LDELLSGSSSPHLRPTLVRELDPELAKKANDLLPKLQNLIQTCSTDDPTKLDELLNLNDALRSSLSSPSPSPSISSVPTKVGKGKPFGLGISIPAPVASTQTQRTLSPLSDDHEDVPLSRLSADNGPIMTDIKICDEPDDEDVASTPKIDKGKGRAEPEPERPAPVLRRPSLVLDDEDEEDHNVLEAESIISPTNNRLVIVS
jgi:protein phosphatase 1 regulatory subunit 37